ncbi:uncharacterized protein [Amphiura filiformis]|uniref:uncharacterized protein n=1 Tax=Amphiura filiformis TaxID=82378 RepID=UPI003B217773
MVVTPVRILRTGSVCTLTFGIGYFMLLLMSIENRVDDFSFVDVDADDMSRDALLANQMMAVEANNNLPSNVNYSRPFPPDDTCYFQDKLSGGGMPDIHSAFADPIGGYIVFVGLKFLPDPWDILNYTFQYENEEAVDCNDILKDRRNIGFMPQYMLVITCPLTDAVRMKKQFVGTLKSSENKTYENITICTSGVSLAKKQFLSICTMVRSVDDFIPDWLDFHRYVGVEHVYIYDNEHPDATTLPKTLKEYTEDGYVTIIPWHHSTSPMKTYLEVQIAHENDCIWRHKHDVDWMIKIDVDEYVQPMDPKRTKIPDYLRDPWFRHLSAIRMSNWFFGHPKSIKPKGPTIIHRNMWRSKEPTMQNTGHDKNILRPINVHYFKIHNVKMGSDTLSADPYDELRLVHYRGDNPRALHFELPQFTERDSSMLTLQMKAQYDKEQKAKEKAARAMKEKAAKG